MSLVLNHSKATGRAKLILLGIANHQGDQGAWPSIATLARYANCSERSVKRDIAVLVELGELIVEVNSAPVDSQYRPNLYWVNVSAGVTDSVSGVTDWVSRGDRLGKSGVTASGTLNVNRNVIKPNSKKQGFSVDWLPDVETVLKLEKQYPNANILGEAEAMVDYLVAAGKENEVKDMNARLRTWLRNADRFANGALSKVSGDEWFVKPEDRVK